MDDPGHAGVLFIEPERQFSQARARRTYERLVEAAGRLFDERGYDSTQASDITGAARVSVGTFYRYFDDKLEIYLEATRRHLAEAYHAVMDRLTPERFAHKERRATVEEALGILLQHVTSAPQRHRVFIEMSLRFPEVAALEQAFEDAARARLSAIVAAVCPREDVPDPQATAFVVHTAVVECATRIAGARGPAYPDPERAMAALIDVVLRALFGSAG